MSIFKRKQQFQGQKKSPLIKIALGAVAAVFIGAGAIALATIGGVTFGAAAVIGLGALAGSVVAGAVGAVVGFIPGFIYAKAAEKSNGDGWHSPAAVMTGMAACAVLGMGYGAYEGYNMTAHRLTDNAKISFNIQALPQKAVLTRTLVLTTPKLTHQYTPRL